MTTNTPYCSIILPVESRVDDIRQLLSEYSQAFESANVSFEIVVALDGLKPDILEQIRDLAESSPWLRIIQFSRQFGGAAALTAGFEQARGKVLMTLPAYWQVKAEELPRLLTAMKDDDDMLLAVRSPRAGSSFERLRRRTFHGVLKFITAQSYRDLGCGVRLLRREVADEIRLYGDQHRFLPVLAARRGFRVREVELAQSPADKFRGRYRIRDYVHRLLDLMTVFFLVRFTKKPLRFFGSIGLIAAGIGALFVFVLVVQRLFFDQPLADRPALLLGSLLVVLGIQLFGLGLLGELVIFSHSGDSKEYAIRSIVGKDSRKD